LPPPCPVCSLLRPPPPATLFPYTTLFRSHGAAVPVEGAAHVGGDGLARGAGLGEYVDLDAGLDQPGGAAHVMRARGADLAHHDRSEEHTSELQSRENLVCRLLLEKKKQHI